MIPTDDIQAREPSAEVIERALARRLFDDGPFVSRSHLKFDDATLSQQAGWIGLARIAIAFAQSERTRVREEALEEAARIADKAEVKWRKAVSTLEMPMLNSAASGAKAIAAAIRAVRVVSMSPPSRRRRRKRRSRM